MMNPIVWTVYMTRSILGSLCFVMPETRPWAMGHGSSVVRVIGVINDPESGRFKIQASLEKKTR